PDRSEDPAEQEPAERLVELDRPRDQDRADEEQQVGAHERAATTEHVADPAGDRHHRHERDQVRVHDPGGVVEPVGEDETEVADDRPQHRRDDGEVVGGDEHAEADDREDRSRGWAVTARQLVGNRLGGDVGAAHVSPPTRTFAGGRIVNDSPYRPGSSTHRESEPSIVVANSARVTSDVPGWIHSSTGTSWSRTSPTVMFCTSAAGAVPRTW